MEEEISGYLEFGDGPYVIVRIGPGAKVLPDAYKWACVCIIKDGMAEPVGLSVQPLNRTVVSVFRKLLHKANMKVQWKRIKDNRPYLMREVQGTDGEYTMKKTKIADISVIFKADGTLNEGKGMAGLQHFLHQMKAGHYSVANGTAVQTQTAPGTKHIVIEFDQVEADHTEAADPAPAL